MAQPPQPTINFRHPDDPRLVAAPEHWDEFVRSNFWVDIKNFLDGQLELVTRLLTTTSDPHQLFNYQGQIQQINTLKGLPEFLKSQAELQAEEDAQKAAASTKP